MSDRLNTILGWLLGAGVVALLLRFLVGFVIPDTEAPEEPGYAIVAAEEGGAEAGPDLGTLLAMADVAAGEASFAKCMACHTIASGGATGIGPNLWAVVGTPIGAHAPGFAYSEALSSHGGEWTYENLDAWLKSPKAFANGTKMSFPGLSDPQERANVIAYMHANGGGPEFPAPAAPAAEEGAEGAEGDAAAAADSAAPAEGEAPAAEAAPAA
ncbi:c-type cytochrome [Alteraurantiacibacter buctensis]|uniref:C-type cytochrome n=1 Tax=Alteraurantiacibacter buctensis TaxID=1503981 RepID=A0A844Z1Y4_9SPHN|nr:cytochrome c family protein [Alteraurantiacibacter buctensis]MXO73358.1 c-type cytochrome [Alteraurantiacibacter buctensis]